MMSANLYNIHLIKIGIYDCILQGRRKPLKFGEGTSRALFFGEGTSRALFFGEGTSRALFSKTKIGTSLLIANSWRARASSAPWFRLWYFLMLEEAVIWEKKLFRTQIAKAIFLQFFLDIWT